MDIYQNLLIFLTAFGPTLIASTPYLLLGCVWIVAALKYRLRLGFILLATGYLLTSTVSILFTFVWMFSAFYLKSPLTTPKMMSLSLYSSEMTALSYLLIIVGAFVIACGPRSLFINQSEST
jgi:hypothetical protein